MALYGKQKQLKRVAIYNDFCKKTEAVLFATDIAARGLGEYLSCFSPTKLHITYICCTCNVSNVFSETIILTGLIPVGWGRLFPYISSIGVPFCERYGFQAV